MIANEKSSRFYTFDKVPKVCRVITPLTAYCPTLLKGVGLSVWLTGRFATALFTDRLIRYALTFLFAKYVCIWLSKHGGCLLNEFSQSSKELTAIFYVMPHLEYRRIIYWPKLNHLFFPSPDTSLNVRKGLAVVFTSSIQRLARILLKSLNL